MDERVDRLVERADRTGSNRDSGTGCPVEIH
jgi:hypothetical protein